MKCFLLALFSAVGYAAYPEVDYFTRLDNASLNANWTQSGGFDVFTNTLRSVGTAPDNMAEWGAGSAPNANHYSYGVTDGGWDARNGGATGGVAFRMDAASKNGYGCTIVAGNVGVREIRIVEWTGGSQATLVAGASSVFAIPANSILIGWAVGTTLNCSLTNSAGTPLITAISTTDATYASGRVGVCRGGNSTNITWPEWWGGNGTGSDIFVTPTAAAEYYMSSTATAHNATGTLADPWPFLDFFSSQTRLPCGSTLWIRGGTYSHDTTIYGASAAFYRTTQSCTSTTGISYKSFPGETVLLDAAAACASYSGYALIIPTGDYSTFDGGYHGWRLLNSDGSCRVLTRCGSNPTPNTVRAAFNQSKYATWKHMVWHDFADGVADNGSGSDGTTFDGLIVFNIGWNAPDRGHGHGGYSHNDAWATVRKTIKNSLYFRNQEYQTKLFSQSGAPVGNYLVDSTAFVAGRNDSGTSRGTGTGTSFLIQGSSPENITMNKVYIFAGDARLNMDAVDMPGFRLTNSLIDGGAQIDRVVGAIVTDNEFSRYGTSVGSAWYQTELTGTWAAAWSEYDRNRFFNPRTGGNGFYVGTTYQWAAYQALGYNASSTYTDSIFPAVDTSPSGSATNHVNVLPSTQPGTGNVVVYNWQNLSAVNADVSTILSVGDPYEVIDPQNWAAGPIATGVYAGGNISLSMTGTTIQAPVGNYTDSPGSTCTAGSDGGTPVVHDNTFYQHTEPYFGIFVVRRRQLYRTVQLSTLNTFAAATQVKVESGPSATVLNFPVQTVACATAALCKFAIATQMTGNTFYKLTYLTAGNAVVSQSDAIRIGVN